jgi:hypothetical protein
MLTLHFLHTICHNPDMFRSTLPDIPEGRRSYLLRGRSLKSRTVLVCLVMTMFRRNVMSPSSGRRNCDLVRLSFTWTYSFCNVGHIQINIRRRGLSISLNGWATYQFGTNNVLLILIWKNVPTRWHYLSGILRPANSFTCFGWNIHPSSGARINCS